MRWFKHITTSADDEKLAELIERVGLEGYGFWWRIMEIVGQHVDENDKHFVKFPLKKWGNLAGISPKKFKTLAKLCEDIGLVFLTFEENFLTVSIPNILKYKDEYTKKRRKISGQCPDKILTKSGQCQEQDTDTDTELNIKEDKSSLCATEEKEQEKIKHEISCPYKKVVDLYNRILVDLPSVKEISDERKQNMRNRWNDASKRIKAKGKEPTEENLLDYFALFFNSVSKSSFLCGKVERNTGRPFKAGFDWIMKKSNFIKIIEGNYNDNQ